MNKHTFFSLLFIAVMSSCGVGDAEKIADQYHEKLDAKEYDYITENLIDTEILKSNDKKQWLDLFEYIHSYWGELTSRSKNTGFDSQYKNGTTTVTLNYTNDYEGKTVHERIYLVKRNDVFRITGILMNENLRKLEEQAANF